MAFVTLDTSSPEAVAKAKQDSAAAPRRDTLRTLPSPLPRPQALPRPALQGKALETLPHYHAVLYLSADDQEVYAALGLMAALQTYGLRPDAVVGESRAALIAAAYALGYSANQLEATLLSEPEDAWILPFNAPRKTQLAPDFKQAESPAFSWTLSSQSLQGDKALWVDGPHAEAPEYLHVSWLISRLALDAPGGPIGELEKAGIPLALQVYDQDAGGLRTLNRGDLQDLLKACLLPPQVARERPSVRPFTDGAQVSAHDFNMRQLPFTFDQLVTLRLSPHLPRRMFGGASPLWRDSLEHGYREGKRRVLDSLAQQEKVEFIDIQPDAGGLQANTPALWRDLGFKAALQHMDVLLRLMRRPGQDSVSALSHLPRAAREAQVIIDPLASGGRELLLNMLDEPSLGLSWQASRQVMNDVMATGFYSQLDVAWLESQAGGHQLVFSAKEQSKISIWAAPRMVWTHEPLSTRGPEVLAGLSWSEPYFIPLKVEVMGDVGGRQPGWALQAFAQPLAPVPLRSGLRHAQWDLNQPTYLDLYHPTYAYDLDHYGVINFRMREKRSTFFLDLWPNGANRISNEVSMRNLKYQMQDDFLDSLRTMLEANSELCLGCQPLPLGAWFQPTLSLHYRTAQLVNEGQVKPVQYQISMHEALRFPYARLCVDMVWSNYPDYRVDAYDWYTGPEVDGLSFANQYFFMGAKALRYTHFRAEALPHWAGLQGRLAYGWVKHEGGTILEEQANRWQRYWELNLSYPTPIGPIRLGTGAFDRYRRLYSIQVGVNLSLLQALSASRL